MVSCVTVLVLLSYVTLGMSIQQSCNYCSLSPKHHLCVNNAIGSLCKTTSQNGAPTSVEIKLILQIVNTFRYAYAIGLRFPSNKCFPEASDMMKVEWDTELAATAQEWANQCNSTADLPEQRSVCNGRFCRVAQIVNITFPATSTAQYLPYFNNWFTNIPCNTSYTDGSPRDLGINAKSQLLRWNFRSIGCGARRFFFTTSSNLWLIVCNLGVGAVESNTRLYTNGTKCSKCPEGTVCDTAYPALCKIKDPCFITEDCFHTDHEVLY